MGIRRCKKGEMKNERNKLLFGKNRHVDFVTDVSRDKMIQL